MVTGVFDLAEKGVKTVGALPQGLPIPTFPSVPLNTLGALLAAALGIVLVSLTDTIATSTSFAARRGDEVDPDQEMIGMERRTSSPASSKGSRSPRAARAPPLPSSRGHDRR